MNRFEWHQGKLHHFIHDDLRAIISAEHVSDYAEAAQIDPDSIPAE